MTDPRIQEEQDWDKECQEAEVRVALMEARAQVILDNVQTADICELLEFARPFEMVIARALRDHDDVFLGTIIRRMVGLDWSRDKAEAE